MLQVCSGIPSTVRRAIDCLLQMDPEFWNIYELLETSWEVPSVLPSLLPRCCCGVWGLSAVTSHHSANQIFWSNLCLCCCSQRESMAVHGQGEGRVTWFVEQNMAAGKRSKGKRKELRTQLSFPRMCDSGTSNRARGFILNVWRHLSPIQANVVNSLVEPDMVRPFPINITNCDKINHLGGYSQ